MKSSIGLVLYLLTMFSIILYVKLEEQSDTNENLNDIAYGTFSELKESDSLNYITTQDLTQISTDQDTEESTISTDQDTEESTISITDENTSTDGPLAISTNIKTSTLANGLLTISTDVQLSNSTNMTTSTSTNGLLTNSTDVSLAISTNIIMQTSTIYITSTPDLTTNSTKSTATPSVDSSFLLIFTYMCLVKTFL